MATTTLSSRDFDRDIRAAKVAAQNGPVFITDGEAPSHVLLSFEQYRQLTANGSILDLLAMPEAADIDFEPVRLDWGPARPAELT